MTSEVPVTQIQHVDDPRIAPYRALKERELARDGNRFIAEGEHLVRRLLASDFAVESVLLAHRRVEEMSPLVRSGVPVYSAPDDLMRQIIGYKFHSGVIACGLRKPRECLDDIVPKDRDRLLLVVCPDIANAENLGSLIRLSAGFGVDAMILGPHCHDPFFRQSVRVSMGTIFKLPLYQSDDLIRDLGRLRNEWGMQSFATVLDESAESLETVHTPGKVALLFGNEAQGLDAATVAACDRRVTIPMKLGTDSFNVAVAAGIFLYHFTRLLPDARLRPSP